jgi:hypothetical protein
MRGTNKQQDARHLSLMEVPDSTEHRARFVRSLETSKEDKRRGLLEEKRLGKRSKLTGVRATHRTR